MDNQKTPIEAVDQQIEESDEIIRLEQDRNKLLRAKREGMREMAEFSAAHGLGLRAAFPRIPPKATVLSSQSYVLAPTHKTMPNESSVTLVPKKRRQISDTWKPFFVAVHSGDGATMQQLEALAKTNKIEYRLLRTQLKYYLSTELMYQKNNKFYLTEAGAEVAGVVGSFVVIPEGRNSNLQSDIDEILK